MTKQTVFYINYSTLNRKEILTQVTAWMNLEIMLSELRQIQKDKHCLISSLQPTWEEIMNSSIL